MPRRGRPTPLVQTAHGRAALRAGQVEHRPARHRVRAQHGVLGLRLVVGTEAVDAGHDVADAATPYPVAQVRGQRRRGGDLVGELGRTALLGDRHGAQRGVRRRLGDVGGVDVEVAHRCHLAADVADQVQVRVALEGRLAGGEGELAEAAQEGQEVLVVDLLTGQHRHPVLGQHRAQLPGQVRERLRGRTGEVDPGDAHPEGREDLGLQGQAHGRPPVGWRVAARRPRSKSSGRSMPAARAITATTLPRA